MLRHPNWIRLFFCVFFILLLVLNDAALCPAQAAERDGYWARRNTFGILVAYSNDSSHILLGDAVNRRLLNIGLSYSRRLLLNRVVNWQYDGELLPVALESDPVLSLTATVVYTNPPLTYTNTTEETSPGPCHPTSGGLNYQNGITET